MNDGAPRRARDFAAEVRSRFGVLPNFFCTAASAPGLIEELWGFAKLPTSTARCLRCSRSVCSFTCRGSARSATASFGTSGSRWRSRPSGDAAAPPESIEQTIALLSRPVPHAKQLNESLTVLEIIASPVAIPKPETEVDTGIGISAADLPRIFGIFTQVHSHQGQANGGLGIGLSLVRQLVEMHGGSVQAASPGAGKGSTFTVRLPLVRDT